ncbi:MAG: 5-formyltetrahydrofolate cyclo-ligase [Candidatus Omnitrophica bacterium]|nr:5-formyltetrahydrofolate cyclo-ligase [Candidatus Omnitrophota bacterium]MCM8806462.1 5-formyltetrahydrofolate cyclo-ligase [Candidatus Omnitrophota bacterium]
MNQEKEKIRKKIKEIRQKIDLKLWEEKSRKIQEFFLLSEFYKNSKIIFTYFHFDKEVKTDLIIEKSLEEKKVVCIPYIDWKNKIIIPSIINSFRDIDTSRKIPAPKTLNLLDKNLIDIIIVPGVAFDIYKNRIGMGGGFYDRFLKEVPSKIKKISFAFEFQVLTKRLPVNEEDVKVDAIITEKRIIS